MCLNLKKKRQYTYLFVDYAKRNQNKQKKSKKAKQKIVGGSSQKMKQD